MTKQFNYLHNLHLKNQSVHLLLVVNYLEGEYLTNLIVFN